MEKEPKKFAGHTKPCSVTCLALSLDGQTLVSGGSDNQVLIWNIPSHQLVKTMLFKGAITNLELRLTDPAIYHPEHKQPQLFYANLKRMIDPPEQDEDQAIEVMVSTTYEDEWEDSEDIFKRPYNSFPSSNMPNTTVNSDSSDNTEELESLRQEVQRLKRINKRLFEVSSKQLLRNKK